MAWEFGKDSRVPEVDVAGRLVLGTTGLAAKAAATGLGLAYVDAARPSCFFVQVLADWTPPFEGEALYCPRQRHR